MSIEDEIKNTRERKPVPVWDALERLDMIAESVVDGTHCPHIWGENVKFQEVVKPTHKAVVYPPVVVGTPLDSIKDHPNSFTIHGQLEARVGAWEGFRVHGTETGRVTYDPRDALGYPKPVVKHTGAMLGAMKALEALKQRRNNGA